MSTQFAPSDDAAPPQPWLRYRGKVAVIEATGIVDGPAEGPLLVLAASAASRGSEAVVLNITRARLDEGSIPILARMKECLEEADVGFALAGQSRAARDLLARSAGEFDVLLYPSITARAPWASTTGSVGPRREW